MRASELGRLYGLPFTFPAVLEAQTWSLQMPALFFSAYSPPRNEQQYRAARVRLHEDLQFASKMVRVALSSPLISMLMLRPSDSKPMHNSERDSICSILCSSEPQTSWPADASCVHSSSSPTAR